MYTGNNNIQQHNHCQQHYNDLNASFTSEGTDHSYGSDTTSHIYNDLQLQQYQPTVAMSIQHQNNANIPNNNNPSSATGIIYGFRTRHLSCIEENDSDSLHSSSMPSAYEMMKNADECFRKLVTEDAHHQQHSKNNNNNSMTSWPDDVAEEEDHNGDDNEEGEDNIVMIDETRLYYVDYLDELSVSKNDEEDEQFNIHQHVGGAEEYWQSTVSEPMHRTMPPPDIMTTSCYGALNSSFGSEMSGPPGYMETTTAPVTPITATSTPTKQRQKPPPPPLQQHFESIYATSEKSRRGDSNRSFDSSCQSQASSIYGGLEPAANFSMTSSLDLKCMSASTSFIGSAGVCAMPGQSEPMELSVMSADDMRIKWGSSAQQTCASPAEELTDEMATNCLVAAENDLQSIRRLLENDASGSVCPSCRISFDKGKRRKLIDTCGHERCYSCMFRNDQCPQCMNSSLKDVDCNNAQGYDTGIGGSTSTIVSPLGSPQPQLRSQVQRTNAAALAKYMQHNQRHHESISPEYHRYASVGKLPKASAAAIHHNTTVTADIHNSNHYSDISASHAFATPPTRRRFFNHKNLRNALTGGHRRTASNGGGSCSIDTASILSGGSDHNSNESKAIVSAEKQKDQLRARLGLLLDSDQNGGSNTNTTTSSSSSGSMQNNSTEQTTHLLLANGNGGSSLVTAAVDNFGSQLSVAATNKDDVLSLCGKFKTACALNSIAATADNNNGGYEPFQVKARKSVARRSARTGGAGTQSNNCGGGGAVNGNAASSSKRNAVYKPASSSVQTPLPAAIQLALKPLFFEVPLQEPDPPFIGRQWLLRELSHILMATETPGVLINGNPGTGKTAFILQLVEYSCFGRRKDSGGSGTSAATSATSSTTTDPDGIYCQINIGHERMRALASHIVGYHFCQADANSTCLVPDFVHSLAAQLCQAPQLSAYREYLLNEPHLQDILSVKECIADAERVMRYAILEPLASLKRADKIPAKTCIILVDALCEAEYHRPDHGQTIAMFLARMTQYFPAWLKLVATVRTQMLEFVKGLSYTKMTLDSWASNDLLQKDMLDYITFRVNHSVPIRSNIAGAVKDHSAGQLKFIGHLQALTCGSMLYAKLILDLIERGQLVIKSSSYKVLPVSLAQIFLLHFNLRFPTACSFERAAPILNVCLAALYPLTLNEIYYTVCALKTADEVMTWHEFLTRFKLLDGFLIKRIDNTYMFFHSSLREWLIRRDEGESVKFLCDFRLGHAAIAFRLSRLQAPLDAEQTLELGHHMLKAHIYRSSQATQSPRDLQAHWVASVSGSVSAALGSLRNVYSPNLKVSRLILLAGASPHHRTEFMGDATILCIAAHEGIVPMVSLLLEFGADVRRTNSQGCTPLILAAMRGHCDVVRLLVAAGSSLGQTDTTQRCALVHAARMGRLNVVKYLLACDWTPRPSSLDVDLAAALQQALIGAAAQDHIGILEDLLEMDGIDVDECDEQSSGDVALTAAARNGCADAVAVLIARGACVERRNRHGCSALWLAVKAGHWAVAERLLQSGADIDEAVTSAPRKTPLMCAAEEGHIELLELLLERGANVEALDSDGFTALSWAALRGRLGAARCLIERGGSNKQHADNNGRTALDLAAYQGSAALVLYLLEQGANIEHIDVNGMRPLDRAIACRNIQVVQVFLRRGAKLGPTTWSMAMGKPEILVVLLNKLLEDGNVLYRKNRFHEAAHRYQYALRKISNLESLLERSAIFAQLQTNLLLNLSRCKRKLNELDESIDLATQAITQKPNSYEGYYARAKARMENTDLNEALVDANEAMQKATQSGVLPEVIEVLKRIQVELLTRITHDEGASSDIQANCSKYEAMVALTPGGATALESLQHEMTDL